MDISLVAAAEDEEPSAAAGHFTTAMWAVWFGLERTICDGPFASLGALREKRLGTSGMYRHGQVFCESTPASPRLKCGVCFFVVCVTDQPRIRRPFFIFLEGGQQLSRGRKKVAVPNSFTWYREVLLELEFEFAGSQKAATHLAVATTDRTVHEVSHLLHVRRILRVLHGGAGIEPEPEGVSDLGILTSL